MALLEDKIVLVNAAGFTSRGTLLVGRMVSCDGRKGYRPAP